MSKRPLELPETVINPSPTHKRQRSSPMSQAAQPIIATNPYNSMVGQTLPPLAYQIPSPSYPRQALFVYGNDPSMHMVYPPSSHGGTVSAAPAAANPYFYPQHLQPQYFASYYLPEDLPVRRRSRAKHSLSWTAQEDKLLMELKDVHKLGWREILNHFKDRTANACQFRWRRIVSGITPNESPVKRHSINYLLD